ncbi:hypothetical protein KTAU_14710 [Thermogemmatispora aurantia]|uniref:Uncharacterized protein n=1 Tax=Thermogemmatispora aurantia TaxID=2045279 RepID=A0A5J4K1I4_9CHLR|nr:hypothetical protein KTAU_14710 [Thermogemmatispora aurantia]
MKPRCFQPLTGKPSYEYDRAIINRPIAGHSLKMRRLAIHCAFSLSVAVPLWPASAPLAD